jgi:hypothetical protein
MSVDYRRLATECLRIADNMNDTQSRAALIHMAQAWLQLAQQAEHDLDQQQQRVPPKHDKE